LDVGTMVLGSATQTNNGIVEKYCYNNTPANCNTYGGLYQWDEAMQYVTTEGPRGICPPGWYIPTHLDFIALGGDANSLKAIGQGIGGGSGTNTTGFSALLVGRRGMDGQFGQLGQTGSFWGSNSSTGDNATTLCLLAANGDVILEIGPKIVGASLRCLRDSSMIDARSK
jgi:uncharacterized protein (TIGR02145 family)